MPTLHTQQERSDYYHKYLASVLGLPFGIGVHVSAASPLCIFFRRLRALLLAPVVQMVR